MESHLVEVRLKKSIVEAGAVWPKDSIIKVTDKRAQELISKNEAEAVPAKASSLPTDMSAKKDSK